MIEIYDDIFPSELVDSIESLHYSSEFPWYSSLSPNSSVAPWEIDKHVLLNSNCVEYPQLVHTFIRDGIDQSMYTNDVLELISIYSKHIQKDIGIHRVKSNLKFYQKEDNTEFHQTPHVDGQYKHTVLIYYINHSDGPTHFFQWNNNSLELYKSVSPKKGRLVKFDGQIYHASSGPNFTKSRAVINFNISII